VRVQGDGLFGRLGGGGLKGLGLYFDDDFSQMPAICRQFFQNARGQLAQAAGLYCAGDNKGQVLPVQFGNAANLLQGRWEYLLYGVFDCQQLTGKGQYLGAGLSVSQPVHKITSAALGSHGKSCCSFSSASLFR